MISGDQICSLQYTNYINTTYICIHFSEGLLVQKACIAIYIVYVKWIKDVNSNNKLHACVHVSIYSKSVSARVCCCLCMRVKISPSALDNVEHVCCFFLTGLCYSINHTHLFLQLISSRRTMFEPFFLFLISVKTQLNFTEAQYSTEHILQYTH